MTTVAVELLARVPRAARVIAQEVVAVGAALGCVLLSQPTGFGWSQTAAVVACLALPLRLRWPWLAMLGCLWGLSGELGLAPALVGLYRIGRTSRSLWITTGWAAAAVLATEITVFTLNPMTPAGATLSVLFIALWMIAPSALGVLVTTRQRLAAGLAALRLAQEAELEARAERARAQERARIAQEIHDAVGHHATLIAVEAAALGATAGDPETKVVAQRVRALAKASLAEMRVALGLSNGPRATGLRDVPGLVERAREAGLRIEVVGGELVEADVEPVVGRAVFRIVQESLTNAAKHAPGAPVRLSIERDGHELVVSVVSGPVAPAAHLTRTLVPVRVLVPSSPAVDPRPSAPGYPGTAPVASDGLAGPAPDPTDVAGAGLGTASGLGLAGMAERARTAGGRLAVNREGQTFTVRAHLPTGS